VLHPVCTGWRSPPRLLPHSRSSVHEQLDAKTRLEDIDFLAEIEELDAQEDTEERDAQTRTEDEDIPF
jgi:hypothetical protein